METPELAVWPLRVTAPLLWHVHDTTCTAPHDLQNHFKPVVVYLNIDRSLDFSNCRDAMPIK